MLYKKSTVLFGIDLAKRDIAKSHQAVVVEGYTDVMAMHLADVTTAVASCGTAFGDEHLSMLRRLMMDDKFFRGELIYVFDGDAAGQAAALKAFAGEQNLAGQSFVAVAADGMDPLRPEAALRRRAALRDLVARRTPLFEFAIRTTLGEHNLDSAEGRVSACASACRWSRADQGPHPARRVRAQLAAGSAGTTSPRSSPGTRGKPGANPSGTRGDAPRPPRYAAGDPGGRSGPTRVTRRCGRSVRRSSPPSSARRCPVRCSTP